MARNGIEWRRRRPKRAAGRLGWTLCLAGVALGACWLVFGNEPVEGDSGAVNPLSLVVPTLIVVVVLLVVPQVVALVRRPAVSADHYALTVRPGVVRTLILPWAQIAELATMEVDDNPYLLVICVPQLGGSGDWPRWLDQGHLRSAKRAAAAATPYDLAVPMEDFIGTAQSLLVDLAQYAPEHVTIVRRAPR